MSISSSKHAMLLVVGVLAGSAPAVTIAQAPTAAAPTAARSYVGLGLGPFGLGVGAGRYVTQRLAVTASYSGFSFNRELAMDVNSYVIDMRMRGTLLAVNVHPWARRRFFLAAGYAIRSLVINADANVAEGIELNGTEYSASEIGSVHANIAAPKSAPYFGFGFGNGAKSGRGFELRLESGIALGALKGSLTSPAVGSNPQLATDLASAESSLQRTLKVLPGIPTGSMFIAYHF